MLFGIRFSEHGDRYFAPEKPHVRICEGLGRAISLFYSTCGLQTAGLIACRYAFCVDKLGYIFQNSHSLFLF